METDKRLGTGEAASVLGCSTNTVRKMVRAGVVPADPTPNGLLFTARDLYALLATGWRPKKPGRPKKN